MGLITIRASHSDNGRISTMEAQDHDRIPKAVDVAPDMSDASIKTHSSLLEKVETNELPSRTLNESAEEESPKDGFKIPKVQKAAVVFEVCHPIHCPARLIAIWAVL